MRHADVSLRRRAGSAAAARQFSLAGQQGGTGGHCCGQLPRGLRVDCLMLLQGERPGGSVGLDYDQGGLCQEGFPEEGPCAGIWRGWEKGEGGTQLGDLPQCPPLLAEVPTPSALPHPESPA